MKRYHDRKDGSRNLINKLEQEMRSRNAINIFDLTRSDQIRSNDQVRSDQRSDRTGSSIEIRTKRATRDRKDGSRDLIKKFEQEMLTRNLIKNSELMTSDRIRSNDQVRSDQRSDRTGNSTDFGTRNSNKNFDQSRPKRTKTCQSRPQPTEADQGRPKPTTADES